MRPSLATRVLLTLLFALLALTPVRAMSARVPGYGERHPATTTQATVAAPPLHAATTAVAQEPFAVHEFLLALSSAQDAGHPRTAAADTVGTMPGTLHGARAPCPFVPLAVSGRCPTLPALLLASTASPRAPPLLPA